MLVWILYFANLLSIYLISYWLPTVLNLSGTAPADAVFAASLMSNRPRWSASSRWRHCRGKFGPQRVLAVMLIIGVAVIGAVGLANPPHDLLLLAIFLMGCCTVGSMTGINSMTATLYPARVPYAPAWAGLWASAGWAVSAGRGWENVLLVAGWPP